MISAWRKLGSLASHWAHSEDSDQTGRISRLIWVFDGRSHFVGFVMRRLKYLTPSMFYPTQNAIEIKMVDCALTVFSSAAYAQQPLKQMSTRLNHLPFKYVHYLFVLNLSWPVYIKFAEGHLYTLVPVPVCSDAIELCIMFSIFFFFFFFFFLFFGSDCSYLGIVTSTSTFLFKRSRDTRIGLTVSTAWYWAIFCGR